MTDQSSKEQTAAAEHASLNYSAAPGVFDEMQGARALVRPYWRPLVESLDKLGRQELQSRWENGRRIVREHGVTYNTYGDPEGVDRPWGLDLVPLLIDPEEWKHIEAGLIQRARLFNLVLADLYGGSQRLLRDGFIPPELVYANPGFLRACRGISVSGQVYIHLHAADLGRSPDGKWWVLADRTQAPSGAGYAWENRTVISRILPEQMRDCQVQRLAGFFQHWREMLFQLAPPGRPHPSIVLLTPGPHNQTYFEHAYLARHLGFPLVEGADLTVRDRRVFLKTIEGLQPVDVIVRRVEDSFCDPLQFRSDSLLGVSGLVEATRANNVTVANALGAGLMESPAFLAFLPGLCRHLLDEELRLPSIATWWCGQAKELRYVLDHLSSLTLKPAFSGQAAFSSNTASGSRRNLADYRRKVAQMIRSAPRNFVAQERIKLSRAPVWLNERFVSQAIVVRAYVASGISGHAVLPGGLTRIAKNANDLLGSMQSGSGSKDTWVLSNGALFSADSATPVIDTSLSQHAPLGVPSRVADHLFWLGRYTERLEQLLRIVRCVLGQMSAEHEGESLSEREALAELVANLGLTKTKEADVSAGMLQLLYDPHLPGGIRDLLRRISSIASAVRDRFSGDTWRILGRLEADARKKPGRLQLASATELSHTLVFDLTAFSGVEMENMTRGRGWRFLDFGRRIERGLSVLKLLQAAATVTGQPTTVLGPVLEIADSVMTYRRLYFTAPQWAGVLALVLRDNSNPRSFAFQVECLCEHSATLVADASAATLEEEQRQINSVAEALRSMDLNALAQQTEGVDQSLADLLNSWGTVLAALSDQVTNRYFSHSVSRSPS